MTYAALEASVAAGAPVELYEFVLGAETWRYTSADADQVYGGQTWTAVPLSRSEIDETAEINRANLTLTAAYDFAVAELFRVAPPAGVILLRIRRLHRGDGEAAVIWLGRLVNCDWSGREAHLSAEPVYTSIRQPGLRRHYSRLCPHVLFGTACRLVADDWDTTATVTAVSGLLVTLTGTHAGTAGYWAGGMAAWVDGAGRTQRQGIEAHAASGQIKLVAPLPGVPVGATVHVWPGCDKTLKTCREKFANRANFGGFKWIPGKNPFTTAVF